MLELPNPFANEGGVIRLLEPAGGDTEALVDSVLAKRYPRPFVIEDDGARCLYFTRDFIQSEMRLDDPLALAFAYTRKMTAFLLFLPQPREILMLGLGGGSLARWCLHHLPKARVTHCRGLRPAPRRRAPAPGRRAPPPKSTSPVPCSLSSCSKVTSRPSAAPSEAPTASPAQMASWRM